MSTAAQISANQANAKHSTGPVTPEGKAISSRNRLTHGFRSATVLLPGDDPAEYEALLAELSEHFGPRDLTEERLTREMADAEWRLRRVRRHMESAFGRHIAALAEQNPSMDGNDLESLAVETLAETGCSYSTWLRYETKFERQYDRAYTAWSRYQADRRRNESQKAELQMSQAMSVPLPVPSVEPPKSASNVQNSDGPVSNVQIARNAPCPCGSGNKYKRCCGKDAPPVLEFALGGIPSLRPSSIAA